MEKRFYLSIHNQGMLGRSVPVHVVAESEDKLRVRLLEDCVQRSPFELPVNNLAVIARAGEEFEMKNQRDGTNLRQFLEQLGAEYAAPVSLTDSNGKNGYKGELTYLQPKPGHEFDLLETAKKYGIRTA